MDVYSAALTCMLVLARPHNIRSTVEAAKEQNLPEFFDSKKYLPLVSFSLSVALCIFVVVLSSFLFCFQKKVVLKGLRTEAKERPTASELRRMFAETQRKLEQTRCWDLCCKKGTIDN